jgi:predicted RNase H-like HicB family nuclease
MNTAKYIYWQDEGMWLGYLEEYADYRTQGETREELEENLKDIHNTLTSGSLLGPETCPSALKQTEKENQI